jgi:hypothetical protein
MSISNPYLTGDEDADLFEDATDSSNKNSNTSAPSQIADKFRELFGIDESAWLVESTLPEEIIFASELISFYGRVLTSENYEPELAALYDVVNDLTEGLLTKYLELHEVRYAISSMHVLRNYSDITINERFVPNLEDENNYLSMITGVFLRFFDWKMADLKKQYLRICSDLNKEPEEGLLEFGITEDFISSKFYKSSRMLEVINILAGKEKKIHGEHSSSY